MQERTTRRSIKNEIVEDYIAEDNIAEDNIAQNSIYIFEIMFRNVCAILMSGGLL